MPQFYASCRSLSLTTQASAVHMSVRFFRTITRGNFSSSPGVNSLKIHLSTNIFAWPPFFQQPSSSQSFAIFHLGPIRNVRMIERKRRETVTNQNTRQMTTVQYLRAPTDRLVLFLHSLQTNEIGNGKRVGEREGR